MFRNRHFQARHFQANHFQLGAGAPPIIILDPVCEFVRDRTKRVYDRLIITMEFTRDSKINKKNS